MYFLHVLLDCNLFEINISYGFGNIYYTNSLWRWPWTTNWITHAGNHKIVLLKCMRMRFITHLYSCRTVILRVRFQISRERYLWWLEPDKQQMIWHTMTSVVMYSWRSKLKLAMIRSLRSLACCRYRCLTLLFKVFIASAWAYITANWTIEKLFFHNFLTIFKSDI